MNQRPDKALLANPRSERIRKVRALSGRSARVDTGLLLAEGPGAVREAVHHAQVRDLYVVAGATGALSEIAAQAQQRGQYVHWATPEVMDAISSDCQGIAAVVRWQPLPLDHAAFAAKRVVGDGVGNGKGRFIAVLWQARDPGNAGTVIRAADAAGAAGVVLTENSVDVSAPKVVRATAGSLFHLPVAVENSWERCAQLLRAAGYRLFATSAGGAHGLFDPDILDGEVALVFGNEARGLPPEVVAGCDDTLSIPMFGAAESLNLAMAATVSLYRAAQLRHFAP